MQILFSKIMQFCTAQTRMEITQLTKNSGLHVFFRAPVRFHSNLSSFLKTWISFHKYDIILQTYAFLRCANRHEIHT